MEKKTIKGNQMEKVLVAGATGYIGRFVALEFKRRSYHARALARDPKKLEVTGKFLEPPVKGVKTLGSVPIFSDYYPFFFPLMYLA